MPSVPCLQTLQRELADSIIRCAPLDEIRILLACGAKVNEPVTQGLRPIHYAAYQHYTEAVNLLLVRGSDVDAMDEVGYTALHLCSERGYYDLVTLLIKHQARVSYTHLGPNDEALGNPPRATLADEPLRLAIKNGHFECAEYLLANGADPNARYFLGSEINLISPLNTPFLELLLKYGANPDSRDRAGLTPLMKAVRHPQGLDAVKCLIEYGADVNAMTSERHDNRTVLHYAVLSGNLHIVYLLLANGANVRLPHSYRNPTPLDFAILRGNVELVQLMINAGADINTGSPIIGTPLHIALSEKIDNKEEIVQILLDCGANPNAITLGEHGPLVKPPIGEYIQAYEQPNIDLIRLLLRYGAKILLKTQLQHPLGILKSIHRIHLGLSQHIMELILDAAEGYSISAIKRSVLMSDSHKSLLLENALMPLLLKHISRLVIRGIFGIGPHLPKKINMLPLPKTLKMYLLYEQ
ncbi:ankyrin repeat and SOCS box protein 15-like [Tachypleus tridentatus]|uniref:ankyrin repeat and SOCS box protein 15-like n=1 Tax=Tachypleus tridentatus TaxID=6853 RepID=UPI003FCF8A47